MGLLMISYSRASTEQMAKGASPPRGKLLKLLLVMTVLLALVFCLVYVSFGQSFPGGKFAAVPDASVLHLVSDKLYSDTTALEVIQTTVKSLAGSGVSSCVQQCMIATGPPCVEAGRKLASHDNGKSATEEATGGYPLLWQKVRSKGDLGMEGVELLVNNDQTLSPEQAEEAAKRMAVEMSPEQAEEAAKQIAMEVVGNSTDGREPSSSTYHGVVGNTSAGDDKASEIMSFVERMQKLVPKTNMRKDDTYYKLAQDDIDLLELATKKANFMARVALLFLMDGPMHLAPVWEHYLRGYEDLYSLYVHRMPRYEFPANESGPFAGKLISSDNVEWERMNLADAQRRLLANAIMNPLNQRFVLLSDSSMPLTDFLAMYRYLIDTSDSFVETSQVAEQYADALHPTVKRDDFQSGSQWVALTRKHASLIVKDRTYYPAFARNCVGLPEKTDGFCFPRFSQWCRRKPDVVCNPNESYIQTVIHNLGSNELNRRSVMWMDREGPWDAHPVSWNAEKLRANSSLLESIREKKNCLWNGQERECFLFAHKFTSDALPLLLEKGQELGLWK